MVRSKRRVPWGWVTFAIVLLGGGAYGGWMYQQAQAAATQLPKGVQVGKVERGDLDETITATGVVAAQVGAKVNIGAEISGRITSLPVDVGKQVQAGQIVATIYAQDLEAQAEQQRQNVMVAQANLLQAQSRVRQAELTAGIAGAQTTAQIDESNSSLKAARARLQQAQAAAKFQPTQTSSEITRAQAALSTAMSNERQVRQTIELQLLQTKTNIDDAKASMENWQRTLNRQQSLLQQGFIARQEVDDSRTALKQAKARWESAEAAQRITKEKTDADLQAAKDQVQQAQATLAAAKAGSFQDQMRVAEETTARENVGQSEASLRLSRTARTTDVIKRRAVEEARAGVNQARANLKQAEALSKYQETQLGKAVVRSPISGTVLTIAAQQGETVAAAFNTPTLITVADLNKLEVRAFVDEVDVGRAKLGLPVEVRVEAYPAHVFHGVVSKISSASTLKDNVVTYETTVKILDANGMMKPDMTADVTLIIGRLPGVMRVPAEALHREVKQSLIYVLHREKKGKERVEKRVVVAGTSDGNFTEIKTGLQEGEEVILAGLPRLGIVASDSQHPEQAGPQADEEK